MSAPDGWFSDPTGRHRVRYWDGRQWTRWVADHGQALLDREHAPPGRNGVWLVLVVALAAPFAAWWLIGDMSFRGRAADQLDYIARAPDIPSWTTTAIGAVALTSGAASVAALFLLTRRGLVDRAWIPVAAMFMGAGVALAGVGRLVTAGSVGANIGGGMAIMFGLPCVVLLMSYATARTNRLIRPRP